ncbi:MAG TPA: rod shape-determining protein MreD [Acidobacteriota bacterium]|nr:rod shape-determining protein MreD [Acidobacteriota bacterium]
MRLIPYILYLFVLGMHEVIWRDVTSIFGVSINLAAFLVMAVTLYKSDVISVWFGFAAGLVLAAGLPQSFGWHALALALVAQVAYTVRARLNLDSLFAKLLLMFCGILLHNVLVLLIDQAGGFPYLLFANALTGAVYTSILAMLFFAFKEGLVTYQKLKAIF